MTKVRLAFYKAQMESWTDLLISLWTGIWNPGTQPYSHVEIGFDTIDGWQYFSSSSRDGGTRWKTEKQILKNPERWDIFESEYDNEEVMAMMARARSITGLPYDWFGIMGFVTVTGQIVNARDMWYCSEACWFSLTGQWLKRISPRRMSIRLPVGFKEKGGISDDEK